MKRLFVLITVILVALLPLASAVGCNGQASPTQTTTTTTTTTPHNNPPEKPIIPSGSQSGQTEISYNYYTSSTDADGDDVKYIINWGDGSTSETGLLGSGTSGSESHIWNSPGTYFITARAIDSKGALSGWSDAIEMVITIRTYTFTSVANPPNSGSVVPSGGSFETGTTVVVTANPNSGYVFDYWGGDIEGNANPINIIMKSDEHIIAYFTPPPEMEPVLEWSETFGGVYADGGRSVQQITDGGYIVCGYTRSYGAGIDDVYLIKTDSNGNKLWDQTFGGTNVDLGYAAQLTSDGGYIIVGETQSFGLGFSDIWMVKTDPNGNRSWDNTFGGGFPERGWSVQQTIDDGYIISGTVAIAGAESWLIKTDSSGGQLWYKAFSGEGGKSMSSVRQTTDGGYIIVGSVISYHTGVDIQLIKTDSNGTKMWDRTFSGEQSDSGLSIQQTADGGYIICGETESYGNGNTDIWIIKTDLFGYEEWNRTFGGVQRDSGLSIQQTADGGYIICGETESYGAGDTDVWLIKTDSAGYEEWNQTFGGEQRDSGLSIQQTADGGYIICGETESYGAGDTDVWLLKISAS